MTRRPGTSLIEVLVTVGVIGTGLISVIALFPMAAITMGQALRDDRTASSALTADGFIRDIHARYVVEPGTASLEPYFAAMDGGSKFGLPKAGPDDPSLPVFVDPMGVVADPDSSIPLRGKAVGDGGATLIPRVSLRVMYGQPSSLALRICSQLDGMGYTDDGELSSSADARALRYNWLWVLQRPVNHARYSVTCRVVVFDKRVHLYRPPTGPEAVYSGVFFTPGQATITVPAAAEVRKGSWIMDAGMLESGIRHANFYRVLSVAESGTNYILELHTPITRVDGKTDAYTGRVVVMPAVADVYERPMLTAGAGP